MDVCIYACTSFQFLFSIALVATYWLFFFSIAQTHIYLDLPLIIVPKLAIVIVTPIGILKVVITLLPFHPPPVPLTFPFPLLL